MGIQQTTSVVPLVEILLGQTKASAPSALPVIQIVQIYYHIVLSDNDSMYSEPQTSTRRGMIYSNIRGERVQSQGPNSLDSINK